MDSWISGFQSGFLDFKVDFWISKWISGFQSGFLDFKRISGFQSGFLDFKVVRALFGHSTFRFTFQLDTRKLGLKFQFLYPQKAEIQEIIHHFWISDCLVY